MTKLTFEQLKKLPQYKIAHKVYYKKYPFCVRFNEDDRMSVYSSEYTSWVSTARERKKWISKNIKHSHRSRFDYHVAFYFEDISDVGTVFEKFKDEITTIEAPLNDNHKDTIVSDLNITTRKYLFHKEYRYKIQLHPHYSGYHGNIVTNNDMQDVLSLCENFDDGSYKLNSYLSRVKSGFFIKPYYGSGSVFLKNYEDVCTLHLIHKNIISSTTKIILIDELE